MPRPDRPSAARERKRELILDAARAVFAAEGLEGASLRAIAARAGYTPAALYFHFDSKEAIYGELLGESLEALGEALESAVQDTSADIALRQASMAFFDFYATRPGDLDLGFYLFRGGMKPAGVGADRDRQLNAALANALQPIAEAAIDMGAGEADARRVMVDVFAHATGLLLLHHTGRIRMFGTEAKAQMTGYVDELVARIERLG